MIHTILVNWNGWRDTISCLDSLIRAEHDGITVSVCDNASRDESLARIAEWADANLERVESPDPLPPIVHLREATIWERRRGRPFRLVLMALDDNLGFAGGNNAGVALALADPDCDYVFLLNNDTEIAPNALLRLQEKMDRDPSIALCGATLIYHDQPDIVQGVGATYNPLTGETHCLHGGQPTATLPMEAEIEPRIQFVIGAAIFARASLFCRIGGLSEDYFLYYEELDLSRRLLPGERMAWARHAVIAHKVGGTIGTGRKKQRASDLSIYYAHRSRIRYHFRYLRAYTPFLVLPVARSVFSYARRGQFGAIRAIWLAILDYILRDKSFRRTFPQPRGS